MTGDAARRDQALPLWPLKVVCGDLASGLEMRLDRSTGGRWSPTRTGAGPLVGRAARALEGPHPPNTCYPWCLCRALPAPGPTWQLGLHRWHPHGRKQEGSERSQPEPGGHCEPGSGAAPRSCVMSGQTGPVGAGRGWAALPGGRSHPGRGVEAVRPPPGALTECFLSDKGFELVCAPVF